MKNTKKEICSVYSEDAPSPDQIRAMTGDCMLEFGAPWCPHCQLATPLAQEMLGEHPELTHIKIYDGKGKPLGRSFKVTRWPTFIFLRDGKEVDRLIRPTRTDDFRRLLGSS